MPIDELQEAAVLSLACLANPSARHLRLGVKFRLQAGPLSRAHRLHFSHEGPKN